MPSPLKNSKGEPISHFGYGLFWGLSHGNYFNVDFSHYAFYLKDGMSILELGAAENSYLPDNLKTSRHVGVGLSQKLMDENKALTETMIVNLNKVVEDRDVDDDNFRLLAQEPFDAVIMANTVEYLTNPREVLR